jgi:tetratricopeptide (TPR) repeat protein
MGASLLFLGKYRDAIRTLEEAVVKESDPELIYPFVGARTLLAIAHTRAGSWTLSCKLHQESLRALRGTDHIYTACFETLSSCGLGEIEVRRGNTADAFTHLRRARRTIGESRRTAGSARLMVRINTALASAYAMVGDQERARELTGEALSQLDQLRGQASTATFECSFAQLWLCVAAAQNRLGEIEAAAGCLQRARESGWLDAAWLRSDPELAVLHGHPVFTTFLHELDAADNQSSSARA